VAGALVYLAWSLEEPLASNDFFAIWGLKGKSIFGDAGIPRRLFDWAEFAFSNPAYPIGLPLLYAGVAFLLGRWDDRDGACLPFLPIATLLVLVGWLKRRRPRFRPWPLRLSWQTLGCLFAAPDRRHGRVRVLRSCWSGSLCDSRTTRAARAARAASPSRRCEERRRLSPCRRRLAARRARGLEA
jgi:hypothetical protein